MSSARSRTASLRRATPPRATRPEPRCRLRSSGRLRRPLASFRAGEHSGVTPSANSRSARTPGSCRGRGGSRDRRRPAWSALARSWPRSAGRSRGAGRVRPPGSSYLVAKDGATLIVSMSASGSAPRRRRRPATAPRARTGRAGTSSRPRRSSRRTASSGRTPSRRAALRRADLLGDHARGDAEFLGGPADAQPVRDGPEGTQRAEWSQRPGHPRSLAGLPSRLERYRFYQRRRCATIASCRRTLPCRSNASRRSSSAGDRPAWR